MRVPLTQTITAALLISVFLPAAASACSSSVSTNFKEMARNFSVEVTFEGKPLAAAAVSLHSFDGLRLVSSGTTGANGVVYFREIASGKYYVEVRHLGVSAPADQIEIRARVSDQARSSLRYRWGETPTEVRQIAGTVMDLRPQGNTPIDRIINPRLEVPMTGVRIELRHPNDNRVYVTTTDERGAFALMGVSSGTYGMHVRTDVSSAADMADFLIQLKPTAKKDALRVFRGELCGGTLLQLTP
jgi:hypothetical protein